MARLWPVTGLRNKATIAHGLDHRRVSEGFWLGLQADHDLLQRRREIDADLARIAPYQRAA
jgi:hypothetical protein